MNYFISPIICMICSFSVVFAENTSHESAEKPIALGIDFYGITTGSEKMQEILDRQGELEELHIERIFQRHIDLMNSFFSGSFPNLKKLSYNRSILENWIHTDSFAENLVHLSLRHSMTRSDADFGGLMNLPSLKILDMSNMDLTHLDRNSGTFDVYKGNISLENISLYGLEELYLENHDQNYIETFPLRIFAPNVKYLHLNESWFGLSCNDFLASLSSLKCLETLELGHRQLLIQNKILDALRTLPALKTFSLRGVIWENVDFSNLYALEKLDISSARNINHYAFAHLTGLPLLETLSIDGSAGWNFSSMNELCSLRVLNIKDFSNWDFRDLSQLSSLRVLSINNAIITPENKEQMLYTSVPGLEELQCADSNMRGAQLATFVPNLKHLTLRGSNITGGDAAQIAQLKNLEILDIGSTSINGASMKKIALLSHLTELSLAKTDMSKTNFSDLPQSLKILNLSGSTLSLASLSTLHSLTQLKKLDLQGIVNVNITSAHIQQLKEALPYCEVLY